MTTSGLAGSDPLRRVLRTIGGYRSWVVAAAALSFVSLGAGIGLIAMSSYLISESALVESTATLALTIVGVRFFAVTRVVSRYGERYIGHLGTFRILTRIRVWFFRGLIPVAPAALTERRSGDVLTRIIDDVETLQDLYLRVLVPPVAAALALALGCGILGSFSPVLGLVLAVYVVLCGIVLPVAVRRLSRAPTGDLVASQANVHATAVEGVTGLADLVAFGREDLLVGELDRLTAAQRPLRRRLAEARGLAAAATALLVGLAALTVLAIGVDLVQDGSIDAVVLAVMPLVAIATFEAVGPLNAAFEHLDRSRAAASRLVELVDATPQVVDPDTPLALTAPMTSGLDLELSGVTFRYHPDEDVVLRDVSFRVPAGSHVALVGPSGSGKSTLTNLLLRFWDYDQGSIRLGGIELRHMAASDIRRLVAVVAQRDHLFDTTLRDNLALGDDDADDDRLWSACEAAAVAETIRALPLGLDERAGEDGSRLSGGERQRVMIARALLTDAPILILDEATTNLDHDTQRRVLDGVRTWRRGLTTIVIAHDADASAGVDLRLTLRDGALSEGRSATKAES